MRLDTRTGQQEPQMPPDPFLGKRIRGYRLEQLLGRGSATAVYHARSDELWQVPELLVTIVLVSEHLTGATQERFWARFAQMAQHLTTLRHPFLFPLYGYGEQDGICYLLTPNVAGELLSHHLRDNPPWTPSAVLPILAPIASALSYIHEQGLVYQFFQPANVLLINEANVQVTGLGLPQLLCLRGLDVSSDPYAHLQNFVGTYMGSPHYLAPEVVRSGQSSPRSDVYSLGMLTYEMLSAPSGHARPLHWTSNDYLAIAQHHSHAPLPPSHEDEAHPGLRAALDGLINRALDPIPEQRFPSPDALVAKFAHILDKPMLSPHRFVTEEDLVPFSPPSAPGELADPPPVASSSQQQVEPGASGTSSQEHALPQPSAHQELLAMAEQLHQMKERLHAQTQQKLRGDS